MKLVRAALCRYVDDTARCPAKLSLIVARLNAKLLGGVNRHIDPNVVREDANIFNTIQQNLGTAGALSIDVKANAARRCVLRVSIRSVSRITAVRAIASRYITRKSN